MATSLRDIIEKLLAGAHLTPGEIEFAAEFLLSADTDATLKADFLRALSSKGETDEEIALFVESFLHRAISPGIDPATVPGPMLDVCGTGGDKLDLFNVSTTSMFVLAAGGAVVVKHGGRSVSSQCGSADVLEALGIRIELTPADLRRSVETIGCGFLFAPHYHPAFKVIAPIRKALAAEGRTSIFNLLGPLLNPARPDFQLVGIFSEAALPKYASVLQRLGRKHAWAVHGISSSGAGMDEISSMGTTHIHAVDDLTSHDITTRSITVEILRELGIGPATLSDLKGGDREENAKLIFSILDGTLRGPKREIVALNAAAGFVVAQIAPDLAAGLDLANEQIDSGRALAKLRALQDFR